MATTAVVCLACGTPSTDGAPRCVECGARLERFEGSRAEGPRLELRALALAVVLTALLVGVFVVGLPFVVRAYDPQGVRGIALAALLELFVGALVGRTFGPRRYLEPALAAALVSGILVPYTAATADVAASPTSFYVAGAVLGVLAAAFGSFVAERRA